MAKELGNWQCGKDHLIFRRYVEKDLFPEYTPEKHNLQYYPTVNDLQNHIHQAIKDIEAGVLPITAQTVSTHKYSTQIPYLFGIRDQDLLCLTCH